jgi:hypothetical protein
VPDEDAPISYEVLERDTPVYSADGVTRFGTRDGWKRSG